MDDISEILKTFDTNDIKSFKLFSDWQKPVKNRKQLKLLELLNKNDAPKASELSRLIYNPPNNEAYQALRKSLKKQLMNFLVLKQFHNGSDTLQTVLGLISLVKYLFYNNKNKLAWKYLIKAEKIALENELFDQLQIIYLLQLEHIEYNDTLNIDSLLHKYRENEKLVGRGSRVSTALAYIRARLKQTRVSGKVVDFKLLLNNVIQDFKLQEDYLCNPKLFYQFMEIFRAGAIAEKDFISFEPFLTENFGNFNRLGNFSNKDISYKSGLLYMMAHTYYKNKKFTKSLEYVHLLKECFNLCPKNIITKYRARCLHLEANNLYFLGNYNKAIELLENILTSSKDFSTIDRLNLMISLAFYYFFQELPSKANQIILNINEQGSKTIRQMGLEWCLKRDILDVLTQYELGNYDIARNRIKSIENTYKTFLVQESYQRVISFLNLIIEIIDNPEILNTERYYNKVDNSFNWKPVEREETQAILFYSWLLARMLGKPLNITLVEMMAQAPQG